MELLAGFLTVDRLRTLSEEGKRIQRGRGLGLQGHGTFSPRKRGGLPFSSIGQRTPSAAIAVPKLR